MTRVANTLNEEWKEAGTKVFALTGCYEEGRHRVQGDTAINQYQLLKNPRQPRGRGLGR